MARKQLTNIDANKNQILNMILQMIAGDHSSPQEGLIWYNSTTKKICYHNGSAVIAVTIPADLASYLTAAGAATLTNKGVDADNNTISNLELDNFKANVIDPDGTLTANSDLRVATQKAVKAYVDSALTGLSAGVEVKGGLDCSSNPNYPAATRGDLYYITVGGKIGGASGETVEAGDSIICQAAVSAGGTEAAVGSDWIKIQKNIQDATTSLKGYVQLATQAETEARTDAAKAVTPAGLVNYGQIKTFNIGDGTATEFTLTHNFNTYNVIVDVREAAGAYASVDCDIERASLNAVKVRISNPVATSNQYVAIVIGPKG